MSKSQFKKLIKRMVKTYGVTSCFDNDENSDLWFTCPECGDPILYEDWEDDEELNSGCCPICGQRLE